MKPKQEDRVSVRNESLDLNLLVAGLKYVNSVSLFLIRQKSLRNWFSLPSPNDGIQKQVKATIVYPLMDLSYKNHLFKLLVINTEGKL